MHCMVAVVVLSAVVFLSAPGAQGTAGCTITVPCHPPVMLGRLHQACCQATLMGMGPVTGVLCTFGHKGHGGAGQVWWCVLRLACRAVAMYMRLLWAPAHWAGQSLDGAPRLHIKLLFCGAMHRY